MNSRSDLSNDLARRHLLSTLKAGHPVSFKVRGGSMMPWIRDGDIVDVDPVHRARVSPGDVAVVVEGRLVRVHRVIEKNREGIKTAGDRLKTADPPAPWNRVLGQVKRVKRNGRVVRTALHPAIGRAWAVLFPLRSGFFPLLRPLKRLAGY